MLVCFFFFNDTATTEIYTLSLHDALPISDARCRREGQRDRGSRDGGVPHPGADADRRRDRKSTRLNSSHQIISYAVFCLKKKKYFLTDLHSETELSAAIVSDACQTHTSKP